MKFCLIALVALLFGGGCQVTVTIDGLNNERVNVLLDPGVHFVKTPDGDVTVKDDDDRAGLSDHVDWLRLDVGPEAESDSPVVVSAEGNLDVCSEETARTTPVNGTEPMPVSDEDWLEVDGVTYICHPFRGPGRTGMFDFCRIGDRC